MMQTERQPEEFLGQIWSPVPFTDREGVEHTGHWVDYARGHEAQSRQWQAGDPGRRRVVDWISGEVKARSACPASHLCPHVTGLPMGGTESSCCACGVRLVD